jgi:hypothetical protein
MLCQGLFVAGSENFHATLKTHKSWNYIFRLTAMPDGLLMSL